MKKIEIHPQTEKKFIKKIKANAKKIGIDKLTQTRYTVSKMSSKHSENDQHKNIIKGVAHICGNTDAVWLFFSDHYQWYKTSPVQKCIEFDNGFLVETENSVYELVKN